MHVKSLKLGIPVLAALVAAGAVGGPAIASSSGPSATAAAKAKSNRGPRGARGPRGLQGPQGPAGPSGASGTNGTNGTNGTAGGGGAEGTILYAGNPVAPVVNGTAVNPPTVIYSGHGLQFTATCTGSGANGLVLGLTTTAGNAIAINGTVTPNTPAPVAPATTSVLGGSLTTSGTNDILFASTDGAVVQLHFTETTAQAGAQCFVFGTRLGG